MIIIPIVFLLLPIDYFDTGKTVCLSKSLFNVECLGCGMTRALKHLVFFDFKTAAQYNLLSFVVAPLISVLWIKEILRVRKVIIRSSSSIKVESNHKNLF